MADQTTLPLAEPAAEAPATDAAVAAPEAAAAPEPAAAPEVAAPETPAAEPTLLELAAKPEDAEAAAADADAAEAPSAEAGAESAPTEAPADAPAPEADKDVEAPEAAAQAAETPAEPAAPEPIEYTYELPEILQMDDAAREATHAAFDAFRANPANPQPLIDLHAAKMQEYADHLRQEQWNVFNETRKQWRQMVQQDDEIGGSGHQTAMRAIARMRDRFASSEREGTKGYNADLEAFDGMLRATGVGDHPVFLKMMHRIAQLYDEPIMGPSEVKPAPQKRGANVMYDHPKSPRGNA